MGRLGGKAASGAGGSRGLAALQGAGWLAATASRRWAAPAAAMWLAVATRACSTVPCKCAEELVAAPTTCSAVATSADRAVEVWAARAEGTWAAACRWVAWAAEADCRRWPVPSSTSYWTACAVAATARCPYRAVWPAARSVRWPIYSLAWSTTVATARAAIARVCCTAWAAAAVGLPCRDGGPCGVEGWLVGTSVVTGRAAYEGGGEEAGGGTRGGVSESGWAGGRRGATGSGGVGTKLPGAELPPGYTRSLRGRGGATRGLRLRADGSASSHVSTVPRMLSEEKYTCRGRCR